MTRYTTILNTINALCSVSATASYSFYVGSNLTASGAVLVGGTGEEVSSHWLKIYPAADHALNETVTVGVTSAAVVPGKLTNIPQVQHTFRYISMDYSDYLGFPPPSRMAG
ncbi:dipeptidase domain containing protein [Penicillium citrinum]|uniref:Dipeptidase domain containing protein n=2 Tax=Penicillium TaxID=5073 RepID=A0A9W9P2I5_PENCI|nr:dipeptidase domain containing protein [Penicillium citrinum]KAJ5234256.1 dipeptidase domain containing protein [Penicillium citrinum]KAJ5589864.1 dipeptidase domain containing protein [Penicillium hetheringtonii]